ncbi:MAG: hypothetical protein OEY59_11510, partial [Deltaproteobacteria bacterium]|nr:hypothetical protein [Deltaproteobacteria bacterium]
MTEKAYSIHNNVALKDLKENTVILGFTGFSDKYRPIDEPTCKWILHNFKGTTAEIYRNEKRYRIRIEQMKPGDTLCLIYEFPPELRKLTVVSQKLIKEFEFRGFLKFKVKMAKGQASQKIIKRQNA